MATNTRPSSTLAPEASPTQGYRSWNAATRPVKRFACDRCHLQKLKCPRQSASEVPCLRCVKLGLASTCVYSPTLRFGRPTDAYNPIARKTARRRRASASQNMVLDPGLLQVQASEARDQIDQRRLPTPNSRDASCSRNNAEIEVVTVDLEMENGAASTENWSWTPTGRLSAIDKDANDAQLFESLDASGGLQQDDSISVSPSIPSIPTTDSGFDMDLETCLHNSIATLFKPPPLHNSPASDRSISSAETCLTRLAELHLSLFQSHQLLSSCLSPMESNSQPHSSRDGSSPPSTFFFKSPIDLDAIFAAAQQLIDCIKYLIGDSIPHMPTGTTAGIVPWSASAPTAYSADSSSSFSPPLAEGLLSDDDVPGYQAADSATLFLVLSCYARLMDIFAKIVQHLKVGAENMDCRDILGAVQIGSFKVLLSSDLHIIITLQVFCHLFQRAHQSIRRFIAGHGKDDNLLAPGLRLTECTIKEDIKRLKQSLKASANL